jgi:pimeloyl-ACP methyl ester carboxylesterase
MNLFSQVIGNPEGETILFIPGFTGSHRTWDRHFQALGSEYRLVLVDLLGFGKSPKPDIAYKLNDHLDALEETLSERRGRAIHVVGYSMGCILALALSARLPSAGAKRVLISWPCFENETQARATISKSSWFHRWLAMDSELAHVACKLMCRFRPYLIPVAPYFVRNVPPEVVQDGLRHTWPSYSKTMQNVLFKGRTIENLKDGVPTLIFQGRDDHVAPLAFVQSAVQGISSVTLHEMGGDHSIPFTHGEEIAARMVRFFFGDGELLKNNEK